MTDKTEDVVEVKKITGDDVKVDVDLPKGTVINRKVETNALGMKKKKKTFKSITDPLANMVNDLKSLIAERAQSIKDKRIEQQQLELAIEEDLGEISEAETTVEFIEQVVKGVTPASAAPNTDNSK